LADQEGRSQRRHCGEDQRAEHHQHLAPVRPQQREQPLHLPPAVVLAADEPPERPEEQKNVLGAVRLVHSFASSSRSSRSRCRYTESSSPFSAISSYRGHRSSNSSCVPRSTIRP